MKLLVVLLLAANVLFLAYSSGYLDSLRGAESPRLAQQLEPGALKVLAIDEDRPALARVAEPAAEVQPAAPAAIPAETEKGQAVAAAPEEKVCLSWRLAAGDAERLVRLFAEQFPDFGVERRKLATGGGDWRVFIPLQGEKAEVDRQRKELNRKGIHDHFAISEGKDRYVISLGVYSTEKAGQAFMARLKEKGVEGARLAQRKSKDGLLQVDATGAAAMQGQVIEAVGRLLPEAKKQGCQ